MVKPVRVQLSRAKGWRMPPDVVLSFADERRILDGGATGGNFALQGVSLAAHVEAICRLHRGKARCISCEASRRQQCPEADGACVGEIARRGEAVRNRRGQESADETCVSQAQTGHHSAPRRGLRCLRTRRPSRPASPPQMRRRLDRARGEGLAISPRHVCHERLRVAHRLSAPVRQLSSGGAL